MMNLIIDIVLLCLTLIALIIAYGLILRTSKDLRRGMVYLFLSLIALNALRVIEVFNDLEILSGFNKCVEASKVYLVILSIFIMFLILGLLKIEGIIKTINGEINIIKGKK